MTCALGPDIIILIEDKSMLLPPSVELLMGMSKSLAILRVPNWASDIHAAYSF